MEEQKPDVAVESSPTPDVIQDPSPDAHVEATTPKAEPEKVETPFHEHPRWKEMIEERNYYRDLAMKAVEATKQPVMTPPEPDPYSGYTPEQRAFWEEIDKRADHRAKRILEEKEKEYKAAIDRTNMEVATFHYERFIKDHPDVEPNSPEGREMAANVAIFRRNGLSPNEALERSYRIVYFPKLKSEMESKLKVKKEEKIKEKESANVETSSIPSNSGLPQKKKQSIREYLVEQMG